MKNAITEIMTRVQKTREIRGFTQEYLAEQMGITQSAYSYIEAARRNDIGVNSLFKIAKALKVDICYLIGCGQISDSTQVQGDCARWAILFLRIGSARVLASLKRPNLA